MEHRDLILEFCTLSFPVHVCYESSVDKYFPHIDDIHRIGIFHIFVTYDGDEVPFVLDQHAYLDLL
jgi:hypothetical protein